MCDYFRATNCAHHSIHLHHHHLLLRHHHRHAVPVLTTMTAIHRRECPYVCRGVVLQTASIALLLLLLLLQQIATRALHSSSTCVHHLLLLLLLQIATRALHSSSTCVHHLLQRILEARHSHSHHHFREHLRCLLATSASLPGRAHRPQSILALYRCSSSAMKGPPNQSPILLVLLAW